MKIPDHHIDAKMLAFDLDDTLLNAQSLLSPRTIKTLRRAVAQGIFVVLCSGRAENAILPFIRVMEIAGTQQGRYIIAFNGAHIFDLHRRTTIYENKLSGDILRTVYQSARALNIASIVCKNATIYSWLDSKWARVDAEFCHFAFKVVDDFDAFLEQGFPKILVPGEPSDVARLVPILQSKLGDKCDIYISKPYFLEVMNRGVGKGQSLINLARSLDIPPTQVLAFGDSMNDESMLNKHLFSGIGIAMQNAADQVQDFATYTTRLPNDLDGVADFLDEWVL